MVSGLEAIGRVLIVMGGISVLIGIVLLFARRIPFLGRLPGDVFIRTDHATVFVPIVTMIILSIILTVILNLVFRTFR